MINYIVHLYREMRLSYTGIEADTPQAAAAIAGGKPTGDADNIEDCDGHDLSAVVDVAGDEDYSQSVTIDFEPERMRKAATKLLAALEAVLPYAQSEHASLFECWKRDGESACKLETERCGEAIDKATLAIAEATTTGLTPAPVELDIDALLAERRQIAVVWCIEDVQSIRSDLDDDQAWEVLEAAKRYHDATIGINWDVLNCHAGIVFGDAPTTDKVGEV
jgi:hypothetical protein